MTKENKYEERGKKKKRDVRGWKKEKRKIKKRKKEVYNRESSAKKEQSLLKALDMSTS